MHYVAQITEKVSWTEFNVSCFKKKEGAGVSLLKFVKPNLPGNSIVDTQDIVVKLPLPSIASDKERAFSVCTFKFQFSKYLMG